jgi:uncharacterized protein
MPGAADLYFDADGRLHVGSMAISKACVDTFLGRELLEADRITGGKIDPKRAYRIFRSPQKASKTFAGIPITNEHPKGEVPRDAICGTTGSHPHYSDGLLCCDAVFWSGKSIDNLALGLRTSPSIGYYFFVDLTPGMFHGQRFDGRLKNIRGHHLGIVPSGRSGLHIVPPVVPRSGLLAA